MHDQLERAAVTQSHGCKVQVARRQATDAEVLGELSATTEQFALVAALGQRADDARTPRLGMAAVLLEHGGEVPPDELRARDATLASRAREQPIALRIEGDGRPFPGHSQGSNIIRRSRSVKATLCDQTPGDPVSVRRVRQERKPRHGRCRARMVFEDGARRPTWLKGTTNG